MKLKMLTEKGIKGFARSMLTHASSKEDVMQEADIDEIVPSDYVPYRYILDTSATDLPDNATTGIILSINHIILYAYTGDNDTVYIPNTYTIRGVSYPVALVGQMNYRGETIGPFNSYENIVNVKHLEVSDGVVVDGLSLDHIVEMEYLKLGNINVVGTTPNMHNSFGGLIAGCTNLSEIEFGDNFDTSKIVDMSYMFGGCESLTELDLSKFNTSNVKYMTRMFSDCSSLIDLNLSNFNTGKVTDMNYMFSGCSNLTSLDVSNFNTSNVTNMYGMFDGCSSLVSLNLESFDTSAVSGRSWYTEGMSMMFRNCSVLESLDLSMFDTSNVSNMTSMFEGCSSLTSLDLTSFDTHNVNGMNYMFKDCTNLTEILVSRDKWVEPDSSGYGLHMFDNCGVDHVTYVD